MDSVSVMVDRPDNLRRHGAHQDPVREVRGPSASVVSRALHRRPTSSNNLQGLELVAER